MIRFPTLAVEDGTDTDSGVEVDSIPKNGYSVECIARSPGQHPQRHPDHKSSVLLEANTTSHPNQTELEGTNSPRPAQEMNKSKIHTFNGNEARDFAANLIGNLGNVPESGRGHDFNNNVAYDESLMLEGTMDLGGVAILLEKKWAGRRQERENEAVRQTASESSKEHRETTN